MAHCQPSQLHNKISTFSLQAVLISITQTLVSKGEKDKQHYFQNGAAFTHETITVTTNTAAPKRNPV
jgi:hypothetical protein